MEFWQENSTGKLLINKMKTLLYILTFFSVTVSFGQKLTSYMVVRYDTTDKEKFAYVFTNEKGDTVTRLDTAKYNMCFSDTIQYFADCWYN